MVEVLEVEEEVVSVLVLDSAMVMVITADIAAGGAQDGVATTGVEDVIVMIIAALAAVIPISRGYATGPFTTALVPILK